MDDEIYIIKVGTDEAVKSIADLRENIQAYKKTLDELEIGSEDYNNVLRALQVNQAALKDAMHATTADAKDASSSMQDISKAAYGAGESYNALVRQMAMLDQEFRATEDVARRNELGKQINEINNRLKELDAERGKFQRNVGNYKSALDGLAQGFKATAGNAAAVINPIKNVKAGMDALSATPVIATLGILASALAKIIDGMKTSEENTNRWTQALAAFKPIGDAATRTLQAVGEATSKLAQRFADLLIKWGLLDEQAARNRQSMEEYRQNTLKIERDIMIANAQLAADVAEAREIATDKETYSAARRLQALEKAQWAEQQIAKNNKTLAERRLAQLKEEAKLSGNSIAMNDAIVRAEVEVINVRTEAATKQRSLLRQINAVRKEMGAAAKDMEGELETEKSILAGWDEIEKAMIAGDKARAESEARAAEDREEIEKMLAESDAALTESIQGELDAQLSAEWDAQQEEKRIFQARIQAVQYFASGVASIAGSIADIYEANSDNDAKAAAKAKGLRIAEATISTISGAVSAYMNTIESFPVPSLAIPAAVLNAATVLAAGYAQIRKIQSTKIPGAASSAGAVVQPPTVSAPAVQQVRTITGASEEERLNRMASGQRVYILASDLQAERDSTRVRIAETSF